MTSKVRILSMVVAAMFPAVLHAQCGYPVVNPCHICPPVISQCAPQPVLQTRIVPQVQTTYRPEQITTYRPVTTTQIRREAFTVDVPVTTHKQVTVDEGGYQMVWVPKVVTKTVAQTQLQKQVQYRDVPYQVVQNVPQVQTRMVPQRTVQYRREVVAAAPACCPPGGVAAYSLPATTVMTPIAMPSQVATGPTGQMTPQQAAVPGNDANWEKVPQREAKSAADIELQSYQLPAAPISAARGMFSRPSASISALRSGRVY